MTSSRKSLPSPHRSNEFVIISGGQTGVDRAALDAAISIGVPHGGWCPKGRLAEDGAIPSQYQLKEMPTSEYAYRTRQNIVDSDGTLVLATGRIGGGTMLTIRLAKELHKPTLTIQLPKITAPQAGLFGDGVPMLSREQKRVVKWVCDHAIVQLNVAGPRASKYPLIYQQAHQFLTPVLQVLSSLGKEPLGP